MADPVFTSVGINPFGLVDIGNYAKPTLVDIDGDGDLDAFIGEYRGNTLFFRNTSTANAVNFVRETSSFGLRPVGFSASPTFVDIDYDGDLDAFVGVLNGGTQFFLNTGTATAANFVFSAIGQPFGLTDAGDNATPTFVDIDRDGDLDAFIGNRDGNTLFFRNTGSPYAASFVSEANNFGLTDVGSYASPTLVDIDGDGDLDAFVGNLNGDTQFFRNTGTANVANFVSETNIFGLTDVGNSAKPTFVDIDGDGDLDAFIGDSYGNTHFFLNNLPGVRIAQTNNSSAVTEGGATDTYTITLNSAPTAAVIITLDNTNNQVESDVITLTFDSSNWNVAQTVTVSALNDTVGEGKHTGVIQHTVTSTDPNYNGIKLAAVVVAITDNDLPAGDPEFNTTPITNPFGLDNVGSRGRAKPVLVDIDGDGDLDAFVGEAYGNTLFFRNTGSAIAPSFVRETSNFGLTDVGYEANPCFADIDSDGDLDVFVGETYGETSFFRNTGSATAANFVKETSNFGLPDIGGHISPALVDIDGDGDLDAFIGIGFGDTVFFRNFGSAREALFIREADNFGLPLTRLAAAPRFVDIDNDGDLDAFLGNYDGDTLFFRNAGSASVPRFVSETVSIRLPNVGTYFASPTFADIDGDGDIDALIGNYNGDTLLFLNNKHPNQIPPSSLINVTLDLPDVYDSGVSNADNVTNITSPSIQLSSLDGIPMSVGNHIQLFDIVNNAVLGDYTVQASDLTNGTWSAGVKTIAIGGLYPIINGLHFLSVHLADNTGNFGTPSTSVLNITIDDIKPVILITSITSDAGLDNTYVVNDIINITLTSDEALIVTGSPSIDLIIGNTTRQAIYTSGNGSNVLIFSYTVQADDKDTDGISVMQNSLALNGGSIQDVAGNNALLTHPGIINNPYNLVLSPLSSLANVTLDLLPESDSGASNTDNITNLLPSVQLSSLDGILMSVGYHIQLFDNLNTTPVGDYKIQASDLTNGTWSAGVKTIAVNSLTNGHHALVARMVDNTGNQGTSSVSVLDVTFDSISPFSSQILILPHANPYHAGDKIVVILPFNESIVLKNALPSIQLDIGGNIKTAYFDGMGQNTALNFSYTVQSGDTDLDGLSVLANSLNLNGATLQDIAGNNVLLNHPGITNDPNSLVDGITKVLSCTIISDAGADKVYMAGDQIQISLKFSQNVTVGNTGIPSIDLGIGGINQPASYINGSGTDTLTFSYTVQNSDFDPNGLSVIDNSLRLNGATLKDTVNGDANLGFIGITDDANSIVATPSTIQAVTILSNAGIDKTYTAGDTIEIGVTFSQIVGVSGTGIGVPSIDLDIGGIIRQAYYVNGGDPTNPSNTLHFFYTVQSHDNDTDGLSVLANSLALNGTFIGSNNIPAFLVSPRINNDANSLVDTQPPQINNVLSNGFEDLIVPVTLSATDTASPLSYLLSSLPANGTLFTDADRTNVAIIGNAYTNDTFYFKPNANFNGLVSFNYLVRDPAGNTSIAATVTINVAAINDPPVANNDSLTAIQNTAITYSAAQLLGNDTDIDNNASSLTIAQVTNGIGGTVFLNADKSVTFTPSNNFTGTATFTYLVTDGLDLSNSATVSITVNPPIANIINGSSGADTLTGTSGIDSINALAGNDIIVGFVGNDTVDGGSGNDKITLTSTATDLNNASDSQIQNLEAISATNATTNIVIDLHNQSEGFTITGGNFNDMITGGNGADVINPGRGNDTVIGFLGNDTVNGGAGQDTLSLAVTSIALNNASDTQLTNIEFISAQSAMGINIDLHKQTEGFTITGSNGTDIIISGTGADQIIGGLGADTINLTVDNQKDRIIFNDVTEFGDSIAKFDIALDVINFSGILKTLLDNGANAGKINWQTSASGNNSNTAVNLNSIESLYLGGTTNDGIAASNLTSALDVANEFNAEFAITASANQTTLLVINDNTSNSNKTSVWLYKESTGANGLTGSEIDSTELQLIGVIDATGTIAMSAFNFV